MTPKSMATVVWDLRALVSSVAWTSVIIGRLSLMVRMAVVLPAPTGPVNSTL